jgi:hypothetical protein
MKILPLISSSVRRTADCVPSASAWSDIRISVLMRLCLYAPLLLARAARSAATASSVYSANSFTASRTFLKRLPSKLLYFSAGSFILDRIMAEMMFSMMVTRASRWLSSWPGSATRFPPAKSCEVPKPAAWSTCNATMRVSLIMLVTLPAGLASQVVSIEEDWRTDSVQTKEETLSLKQGAVILRWRAHSAPLTWILVRKCMEEPEGKMKAFSRQNEEKEEATWSKMTVKK